MAFYAPRKFVTFIDDSSCQYISGQVVYDRHTWITRSVQKGDYVLSIALNTCDEVSFDEVSSIWEDFDGRKEVYLVRDTDGSTHRIEKDQKGVPRFDSTS